MKKLRLCDLLVCSDEFVSVFLIVVKHRPLHDIDIR